MGERERERLVGRRRRDRPDGEERAPVVELHAHGGATPEPSRTMSTYSRASSGVVKIWCRWSPVRAGRAVVGDGVHELRPLDGADPVGHDDGKASGLEESREPGRRARCSSRRAPR